MTKSRPRPIYGIKGEKEFEDWDVEREAMSIVDGARTWHIWFMVYQSGACAIYWVACAAFQMCHLPLGPCAMHPGKSVYV